MRVVTFGEIMLRLAPENYLRFVQADRLEATFGGAEANVAVSLANFGDDVSFVSKLPSHEIGQSAINSLRKFGVGDVVCRKGRRASRHLLLRKRREPTPEQSHIRQGGQCNRNRNRRRLRLGQNFRRRKMVPLYGNHARAFRHACRHCLEGCQNRKRKRNNRVVRPEFPQKTLEQGKSERSYERDLQVRRRVYSK